MDSTNDSIFASRTPASPGDNSTHGTTPGTVLTKRSQDTADMSSKRKPEACMLDPPVFSLQTASEGSAVPRAFIPYHESVQDPFVAPKFSNQHAANLKLSPSATSFIPMGKNSMFPFSDGPSQAYRRGSAREPSRSVFTDESSNTTSTPASGACKGPHSKEAAGRDTTMMSGDSLSPSTPFGPLTPAGKMGEILEVEKPLVSVDPFATRFLKVSNLSRITGVSDLNRFLTGGEYKNPKTVVVSKLYLEGVVYIHFPDIRDAVRALTDVKGGTTLWNIEYISCQEYLSSVDLSLIPDPEDVEAKIIAAAMADGSSNDHDVSAIAETVKSLLQSFGDLMSCEEPFSTRPTVAFRAEFCDAEDAKKARGLTGVRFDGTVISVRSINQSPSKSSFKKSKGPAPIIVGQDDEDFETNMGSLSMQPKQCQPGQGPRPRPLQVNIGHGHFSPRSGAGNGGMAMLTPVTPNYSSSLKSPSDCWEYPPQFTPPLQQTFGPLTPGPIGAERVMSFSAGSRTLPLPRQGRGSLRLRDSPHGASNSHNVVDLSRIRQGLDVRTTIMLRNIPNRVDQTMLKQFIDETSYAQYDFMYLRIDFANNCNVGYAFINFEDPWSIINFVDSRAGKRWNCFNSDKIVEVSYATIQGKDCLVQKFRNSSVMLEHPSFRPKVYFTGSGPLAGTEDAFPGPDNSSKMKRSIENAEHVGLFAPRAGQHYRDEQRRRRSQYDRGTRMATAEDFYDTQFDPYHRALDVTPTRPVGLYPQISSVPRGHP